MSSVDLIFNLLAKDQTSAAFRTAGNSMGRFGKDAQAAGKAAAAAGKSTAAAGKDVESAGSRMHKALAGFDCANRTWTRETTGLPLHAGAEKYFRERGWLK